MQLTKEQQLTEAINDFTGGQESHAPILVKRIMKIFALPEEKKNTMENSEHEEIDGINTPADIYAKQWKHQYMPAKCGFVAGEEYAIKKFSLYKDHPTTSSGSVAAPKEDEPWYITQAKQCEESAEKLRAKIIELQDKELTSLRQQLAEHTAINSLLAGDEPEVVLANEVFKLNQQLKEREEAIRELLPITEDRLFSVPVKSLDAVNEIVSRAKALLDKQ